MFNVSFDENFIDESLSNLLLEHCHLLFDNQYSRSTLIFGDEGLVYTTSYTKALNWSLFPELLIVKQQLETINDEIYNFCAIMCYPNGEAVIKKHRDKEIPPGSQICGLSLGATRQLKLSPIRSSYLPIILNLTHGSLYCLFPPTNDHWLHEILPSDTCEPRYSLTFRNIPNALKVTDLKYCPAIFKTGLRKGQVCGAWIQNSTQNYCKRHFKK